MTNQEWNNGTVVGPAPKFYSLQGPEFAQLAKLRGFSAFQGIGSATATYLTMNTPADYVAAWEKCPPLVSIICAIARMDYKGRVVFYKPNKDEEIKPSGYNPTVKSLAALFAQPNPLQTWPEFRAQQVIYKRIFGICPVLTVKAVGFTVPKMMWNIPPHVCRFTTSGKLYYQSDVKNIVTKFEVVVNGQATELPIDDMIFLRDQTISLNSEWLPDSRLKSIIEPISNIVAIGEAENVLITKRGALGIFSNSGKDAVGTMPVDPTEKANLQADLNNYGLSHAQAQFIVTTASLQWQQIGVNPKDLMLIEFAKAATEQICDNQGYRYELLAKEKGSTFANQKESEVAVYQNTIIPECDADFQTYNNYFKKIETGFEVWCDYSHVEALQKSKLEAAQEREATNKACIIEWEAGKLTLNEWQIEVGGKKLDGEQFDMYKPQYDEWLRTQGLLPPMVDPNKQANNEPGA